MKKRLPYIILIIWTLWLIWSLSYLFKNTAETTKQNTTTSDQNTKVNTRIDTEINTEINTNVNANNNNANNNNNNNKTLKILMPWLFFNEAFIKMWEEIKKKEKITINYQSIENLEDYKNYIQKNITGNNFDIFLIPMDWIKSLETKQQLKKIPLTEDSINYMHPLFTKYLDKKNTYTLIPYALDPLVSFIAKSSDLQTKNRSMGKTLAYLSIAPTEKAIGLPVLRWISKNDIRLLEQNKGSFPNYFSILYNLLYQFQANKDSKSIDAMLQLSTFDSKQKRDYVKFILLVKKIQKRNQYCEIYPDTCLFAYKFADIKFGYLSDLIIWNKYFKNSNRTIQDIDIVNFPISSQDYKVRWRAFVINNNTNDNKDASINTFVNYYLKAWVTNQYALWDNIRSADNTVFDFQKSQKKYKNILQYEKNFSLIYAGRELQQDFLKKTQTIKLLKEEITSEKYLENLDWMW